MALARVSDAFARLGILLESNAKFPSVVGLAVGLRLRGSWWSHRDSHAIFRVLKEFASRKDTLATRLVSAKVTFVQERLWPDLVAVATAREAWQLKGLSRKAASLLALVEKRGEIDTVQAREFIRAPLGEASRELERRLLVQGEEFHTEGGFHAKRLRSWTNWSESIGLGKSIPSPGEAKSRLEGRVAAINRKYGADGSLPWLRSK